MKMTSLPSPARWAGTLLAAVAAATLAAGTAACGTDVASYVKATFSGTGLPAGAQVTVSLLQGDVTVAHSAVAGDDGRFTMVFAQWDGDARPEGLPSGFEPDKGFSDGVWAVHVTTDQDGLVVSAPATATIVRDAENEFSISFSADPAVAAEAEARAQAEAAQAEAEAQAAQAAADLAAARAALGQVDDPETPDIDEGSGALGAAEDEAARANAAEANAAACDDAATPAVESCSDRIAALEAALEAARARCEADVADCDDAIAGLEALVAELQAALAAAEARCEQEGDCDDAIASLEADLATAQAALAALQAQWQACIRHELPECQEAAAPETGGVCINVHGPATFEVRVGGVVHATESADPPASCADGFYVGGLAPATYLVEVRAGGWETASTNVEVAAGATQAVNFTLSEEVGFGELFLSPPSRFIAVGETWCLANSEDEAVVRRGTADSWQAVPAAGEPTPGHYTVASQSAAVEATFTGGQWCLRGVAATGGPVAVRVTSGTDEVTLLVFVR